MKIIEIFRLGEPHHVLVDDIDMPLAMSRRWHLRAATLRDDDGQLHQTWTPAKARIVKGRKVRDTLARLIMRPGPGQKVRHRSGSGLDCRRENLSVERRGYWRGRRMKWEHA